MNLHIQPREKGGVTVLDLSGRLVYGEEARELRRLVKQLLAEKKTRLVSNLEKVNFIDSVGVGTLISCFTSAKAIGGDFKLLNPSRQVAEVLRITTLGKVLEVFDSEEQALASFA